jgi:hypothetical protein
MIRRPLRALALGLLIIAAPCLATADSAPKKSPKVPPKSSHASPPSRSSKTHGSLHTYHPHQGKSGNKPLKSGKPGQS